VTRRAALAAVVALAVVAVVRVGWRRGTLPPLVTVEDVVAELAAPGVRGRLQDAGLDARAGAARMSLQVREAWR
jgi:hypothetical protein